MSAHIPNWGEQMVGYYRHYSNISRGKRQQKGLDNAIPCILKPQENVKAFRKSWSRLIQKIYETDPLICPRCNGTMRTISSIVGDPENPQTSETMADKSKATAKSSHLFGR